MAINEFKDQSYTCTIEQMVPPLNYADLYTPLPTGFGGSRMCPITNGNTILNQFDINSTDNKV